MGQQKKDGEQWLSRAVQHAHPDHLRATFTVSLQFVGKLPGQVGQLSGRAAGVLTKKDARSVRRRLSITTVLVSVLAVVVAAVGNFYLLPHTPEETADRYLTALQNGDYLGGMDTSAYSTFENIYLPNAAYEAATGRVESFSVTGSEVTGPTLATVHAKATVGGREQELSLPLERVHKSGPYNDLWQFAAPTHSTLRLITPVALTTVNVNGVAVDLPAGRRAQTEAGYLWQLPLLAGDFTFELPKDSYYSFIGTPSVTSPLAGEGDALGPLQLNLRPSARMWNETNTLIESWLSRCESSHRLDAPGCPTSEKQGKDSTATIKDVRWELIERPTLVLLQDPDRPDHWRASRYRPATFELTYSADGKAQRETITFYISAEVVSNGSHADMSVGLGGSEESEAALRQAINSEDAAKSTLQKFTQTLNTP